MNDLEPRLKRIEALLERLQPRDSKSSSTITHAIGNVRLSGYDHQVDSPNSQSTGGNGAGRLVPGEGDGKYVTNSFWTDLDEAERKETNSLDHSLLTHGSPHSIADSVMPGIRPFILGAGTAPKELSNFHPTGENLFILWQTYLESVDPVLKIIHVPVIQRQLFWASQHLAEIPPAFESLMFSIYFAAITSMQSSTHCQKLFHEDRQVLLRRYTLGFEQALANADFMRCPDFTTIQAMTLHLICARFSMDKAYVWSMVGLLVRLAMKLGLHRDPADLELSPFISEMRRRLWWQIYVLDIRTAEDSDMDPFICEHVFNTRFPTNVNDVDLDSDMIQPISGVQHRTEMLFTLLRFEVSCAARRIVFSSNYTCNHEISETTSKQRNDLLDVLVSQLQEKYFKYCDPQVPICFLAERATRMVITKLRLTINHPARRESSGISKELLQDLVLQSIEIIEGAHILRTHEKYSRWVWLFEKYIEWDAVAFLLHVLGAIPLSVPLERAWKAIEVFFNDWKGRSLDHDRWQRLEKLQSKASAKHSSQNWYFQISTRESVRLTTFDPSSREQTMKEFTEIRNPNSNTKFDSHSGSNLLSDSVTAQTSTIGYESFESTTIGDQVDWNFDQFSLVQGVPSWNMESDENAMQFISSI
jgi:hypothetical protein